jgi:type IV pilus assembly protein PilF
LLGIVYQRLGKTVLAGEHLAKAVSIDPYDPYALNALGSFECDQAQYDAAISRFKAALDNPLYPTPWVASHNAGQCSERQGNAAKAEDYYRAALKRNPGFAQSLARMAHISAGKGQSLSERAYLQRYAGISPLTADLLLLDVRAESVLGDAKQAALYAAELRKRYPTAKEIESL